MWFSNANEEQFCQSRKQNTHTPNGWRWETKKSYFNQYLAVRFFSLLIDTAIEKRNTSVSVSENARMLLIVKAFSSKMQFSFEHHYDFWLLSFNRKIYSFSLPKLDLVNCATWWYKHSSDFCFLFLFFASHSIWKWMFRQCANNY